jgi:hypothetical protein
MAYPGSTTLALAAKGKDFLIRILKHLTRTIPI